MDQDIRPAKDTDTPDSPKPDNDNQELDQMKPSEMVEPSETAVENQALDSADAGAPVDVRSAATSPVIENSTKFKESVMPKTTKPKSDILKVGLMIGLALIISGASAGAAYWYRDTIAADEISSLKSDKKLLEDQLAATKSNGAPGANANAGGSSADAVSVAPSQVVIENIKASITSGNTAALESYSAESVNVILAASEAFGPSSRTEAVSSVTDFIDGVPLTDGSWDFELPAEILSIYSAGDYAQYFPANAVVGKASNGKVISFSFDADSKISTIFMSESEDLLN